MNMMVWKVYMRCIIVGDKMRRIKKQATLKKLLLYKVVPGIILTIFESKKETAIASRLSRTTGYSIASVFKTIKKLEGMIIIEYVVATVNKTNKPFKLTQKGKKIAACLQCIK